MKKIAIPVIKVNVLLMMTFFIFTNHAKGIKAQNAVETELKGTIVFSNQPFEGDNSTGKTVTEFKAWDEIYARIIFEKPLKEMLTGYFAGAVFDNGSILVFELKRDSDGDTHYGVERKLKMADLERKYIDLDIAPSINNSRDYNFVNFGPGVANFRSTEFENRTKCKFTLSAFFWNDGHDKIEEQYINGGFTLDYSSVPDGDEGVMKIGEWERQINQASQEEQVLQNAKKRSIKPTIAFSTLPLENTSATMVTTIKATEPMYARITLAKPLKDYIKDGESPKQIRIDIKCLNDNITGLSVEKLLRSGEFNNAYIDFDISPAIENAKDVYTSNMGFYFTLFGNGTSPGKKVKYEISLANDYNINYNGFKKMESFGELEVDYTGVTAAQITELNTKCRKAGVEAEKNADKLFAKEAAELVKTMPLPVVFTRSSKSGYTGYSNAVILQMIKTRFKVTEVYMLTFDEADGTSDFRSLVDLNNYPSEKLGNHVFYFAFKDPIDGAYKFSGALLRMLYEGNGKYSEAFLFPYSPIMEGDVKYPYDNARDKMGYESVFFMDGAKIKK